MAKTTIDLPEELQRQVEVAAKLDRLTEEDIIRAAVEEAMRKRVRPKPRLPLFTKERPEPDMAERLDEYLKGFGRDRSSQQRAARRYSSSSETSCRISPGVRRRPWTPGSPS